MAGCQDALADPGRGPLLEMGSNAEFSGIRNIQGVSWYCHFYSSLQSHHFLPLFPQL